MFTAWQGTRGIHVIRRRRRRRRRRREEEGEEEEEEEEGSLGKNVAKNVSRSYI